MELAAVPRGPADDALTPGSESNEQRPLTSGAALSSPSTASSGDPPAPAPHVIAELQRVVGVLGASLLGLGSILGTGVFVGLAVATDISGSAVLLALFVAATTACCNALSSAQLAAAYPRSGGTYEYGHILFTKWRGGGALAFSAGWLFLCAKVASAASAALGFAGYAVHMVLSASAGGDSKWPSSNAPIVAVALVATVLLTVLAAAGMRRSNAANAVLVGLTVLALLAFVLAGLVTWAIRGLPDRAFEPFLHESGWDRPRSFLRACAYVFVAYTGYGRVATLSEEVHRPRRTIPVAIMSTLGASFVLYATVACAALLILSPSQFAALAPSSGAKVAPIEAAARQSSISGVSWLVSAGAAASMLGVLLNLLLGLSRVLLAMARRGEVPALFARLNAARTTPVAAVLAVGACMLPIVAVGSLRVAWSFSAVTVLIYYALTNLAALQLEPHQRFAPRWVSLAGLVCCLCLAFFVELVMWGVAAAVVAAGHLLRLGYRRCALGGRTEGGAQAGAGVATQGGGGWSWGWAGRRQLCESAMRVSG